VVDFEYSKQDWKKFRTDMRSSLFEPFALDEQYDYGLVVAAVCFGITYENLVENWEEIRYTAAIEASPGTSLMLINHDREARNKLGALLTIAFLADLLLGEGYEPKKIPEPIREWIRFALEKLKADDGGALNPKRAPWAIKTLGGGPHEHARVKPQLYLKIDADTTKKDVERTWPQVELRKIELYGPPPAQKRTWRTYARDAFIWERVRLGGMTFEKAYDEWLINHAKDNEVPVEISAIIRAVNRIDHL